MLGRVDSEWRDGDSAHRLPGLAVAASAWIAGIVVAAQWPSIWVWLGATAALLGLSVVCWSRRSDRAAGVLALAALSAVSGSWLVVQRDFVAADHVSRYIGDEPALVQLRGTVANEPREVKTDKGPFGRFNYQPPGTLFEYTVSSIDAGEGHVAASGRLIVRLKQHDHRPAVGQPIEVTGWMSAVGSTQNPGEFDYRAYLNEQGISGRITLMRRGNWRALGPPPRWTMAGVRRSIGDAAAASLRLGMPRDAEQLALLDALLLGRRSGGMADLSESFRAVGLSHVLSISGAHLGILLFLVWAIGRLLIGRPGAVSVLVIAVLVLFLLAVPWRTPIVRAAIMAGVFCVGYGLGRRLTGLELLSAAALIVLIWKPGDVFSAGFQLSFGVVGAILLFAKPVSQQMMKRPDAAVVHPSAWDLGVRYLVDVFAVSVVAFLVALPVVMYHFQLVSPLAVLLSIAALPVLTLVLGVGYLKILAGLCSPAVGSVLTVPLAWSGGSLTGLVKEVGRLPMSSVGLWTAPSLVWTVGCLALVIALLSGLFAGRRVALVGCVVLVSGWGWFEQRPRSAMDRSDRPALVLNMLAVGDGSCFLLRSGDEVLMFDCGSQGYWQIGERSVVPALESMSVRRIDRLMLSHADLDHFVGVLDVVDAVSVGEVLVSPDVMREAAAYPDRAAGFLVASLRDRGYEPVVVEAGWRMAFGEVALELLWPVPGYEPERNNDGSLVLSVRVAGRRVLLNGDIQNDAIG
ncbi:MAG: ComEC/Rec2 family competence protein, partial [Phycisphaeraceae bacterium]